MDATELRIGIIYNHPMSPNEFNIMEATDFISEFIEQFKPIPITEEWLLKLGFIKEDQHEYYIDVWAKGHPSARFEIEWRNNGILLKSRYQSSSDELKMGHIKYVHQLQNLYHALTGTELTLT